MRTISFRRFLEAEIDQKVDRASDKADYFDGLEDEMGVGWNDLVKSLEAEPWVSAHFDLGPNKYKLAAWEVVPGSMTPNGASIRLKPQKGTRSYVGNRLNKSAPDEKVYHLSRQQLVQFLTTGWSPAVQAASSGGMPGMPMGGGMPGMGGGGAPPMM